MEKQTFRDKRTWVKGIFADCPLGTPLPDCPANGVRNLPLAQLVCVVNSMSEAKLDAAIAYHENCLRQRDAEESLAAV
jgi:hypothetical protein